MPFFFESDSLPKQEAQMLFLTIGSTTEASPPPSSSNSLQALASSYHSDVPRSLPDRLFWGLASGARRFIQHFRRLCESICQPFEQRNRGEDRVSFTSSSVPLA